MGEELVSTFGDSELRIDGYEVHTDGVYCVEISGGFSTDDDTPYTLTLSEGELQDDIMTPGGAVRHRFRQMCRLRASSILKAIPMRYQLPLPRVYHSVKCRVESNPPVRRRKREFV